MPAPLTWFPSPFFAWLFTGCFWAWMLVEGFNQVVGRWRPSAKRATTGDRGSYQLLLLAGFLSFWLAYLGRSLQWGVWVGPEQWAGLLLLSGGLLLRQWAILTLGRHFSTVVTLAADHHLVMSGPYRRLRHPAYTGSWLSMAGFHLALGSWGSLLLMLLILMPALVYRIGVEERLLLATFGETYRRYQAQTWRLFPGW